MAKARAIVKRRRAVQQHQEDHADDAAHRHGALPEVPAARRRVAAVYAQDHRDAPDPQRRSKPWTTRCSSPTPPASAASCWSITSNRGLCGAYNAGVLRRMLDSAPASTPRPA